MALDEYSRSLRKRIIIGACVGLGLAVVGAAMIPVVNVIVREKIKENVVLKEGGMLYDLWKNMTIPVYMQFYMFNLTNPEEVKNGQRPVVEQIGPYTYREERLKFDIQPYDNGTMSYRQNKTYTFAPDMSHGLSETDNFTTINSPVLTLLEAVRFEDPTLKSIVSFLLSVLNVDVFMTRPVKEILWGYEDPLLKFAVKLAPDWFYTDYIGYFMNKNDTNDGVYTIYTGETDVSKLGIISEYNGSRSLKFWSTKWANMVNGTDGTTAAPFMEDTTNLSSFISDICRSITAVYTSNVKSPQGIDLHRFTGPPEELGNTTINPNNIGFCTPEKNCFDSGVLNISTCQTVDYFHIPVAISFPHFYMASEKYIDGVGGMSPNKEEHEAFMDLEPMTGLVLRVARRLQINMFVRPDKSLKQLAGIKEVVFPIFWLNESYVVDDANAQKLKDMLFTPLLISKILEIILMAGGGLILILSIACGCMKSKPSSDPRDEIRPTTDENEPLLSNNSDEYRHGVSVNSAILATGHD